MALTISELRKQRLDEAPPARDGDLVAMEYRVARSVDETFLDPKKITWVNDTVFTTAVAARRAAETWSSVQNSRPGGPVYYAVVRFRGTIAGGVVFPQEAAPKTVQPTKTSIKHNKPKKSSYQPSYRGATGPSMDPGRDQQRFTPWG